MIKQMRTKDLRHLDGNNSVMNGFAHCYVMSHSTQHMFYYVLILIVITTDNNILLHELFFHRAVGAPLARHYKAAERTN